MQWWMYLIFALIGVFTFLFVTSLFQAKKASVKLDAEQFKEKMRKAQLIDVRNKNEFDTGHINGARNINVNMIPREANKLRKDQPVFLYCASGKRSSRAAVYLKARGFNEIYELKDGLRGWNGPLK